MANPIPLDPATPMAALLALCEREGIPRAEVARRIMVKPPSLHGYEEAGPRVQFSTLEKVAGALGYRLRLVAEKK